MMNLNNNMMNNAMNTNNDNTDIVNQLKAGRIQQLQLDFDMADHGPISNHLPMFGKEIKVEKIGRDVIHIEQMSVVTPNNIVSYDVERRSGSGHYELLGSFKSLEEAAKFFVRIERTVENYMKNNLMFVTGELDVSDIKFKSHVVRRHGKNLSLVEGRIPFTRTRFYVVEAYGFQIGFKDPVNAMKLLKQLHEKESCYAHELLTAIYKKEIKF